MTQSDWDTSAAAWLAHLGEDGDKGRQFVLDALVLQTVRDTGAKTALDVGCGEGRFCRIMADENVTTTGIDPTQALLDAALQKHPESTYQTARTERLPFDDNSFDICVSYVALIDILDHEKAIAEMAHVTRPSGHVLVANLQSNATARHREAPETEGGWIYNGDGPRYFAVDDVLQERCFWTEWSGLRIKQYPRPLSSYMQAFLNTGLDLVTFTEPPFIGGAAAALPDRYNRMPWFLMMLWRKPNKT